jgi:carboxylesterase type B
MPKKKIMSKEHCVSSKKKSEDNDYYQERTDVRIVVTINYRLGIFGFLPITDSINRIGGMNGIVDQIHALEWIQDRTSFFGGDPDMVTIFGESAGAMSLSLLSVIPEANVLFKKINNGKWQLRKDQNIRKVYTESEQCT